MINGKETICVESDECKFQFSLKTVYGKHIKNWLKKTGNSESDLQEPVRQKLYQGREIG